MESVEVTEAGGKTEFSASDPERVHIEAALDVLDPKLSENHPKKIGV